MQPNEELKKLYEERGKLKAEWRFISNFFRAEQFSEQIFAEARKGHELMECEGCGGLRGKKNWSKT